MRTGSNKPLRGKLLAPPKGEGNGYEIINRACCVLAARGMRKEAKELHQQACLKGYDFYHVLKLLALWEVY